MKDEIRTNKRELSEGLVFHPSSFILHPSRSSFILEKGFTLLEVLLSLAIVGALLVTLIYTLNYHLGIAERQETITVATLLAKNKMADMEKTPVETKGTFDAPYDSYTYETAVKESPYPHISEIIVTVNASKEKVKLNEFIMR